ncbi:MAG: ParA family protein [Myxococcota bacterium]|nr:ParA family protein [Myxococcota bacterium]
MSRHPTHETSRPAPRRIAFVNEKGGSAKTTLVASLAAHLSLNRGHRVLALDMDPQGHLGKVLGVDPRACKRSSVDLLLDEVLDEDSLDGARVDLPTQPSRIPGLDVIVASKALALAPGIESDEMVDPTGSLRRHLDASQTLPSYDFLLIDSAPSFGALTLNVLRGVDELVIPVPLTYLALDGCAELLRTVHTVRTRFANPRLRISMVIPTFYRRTRLAHEVLDRLKERFPKELAHTALGYHVKIDEAQSRGLSIFEYAPKDRAARALAALAEELELRRPGTEPNETAHTAHVPETS